MRRILIPLLAACAAAGLAGTLYLVFYVTKLEQNLFFNQKIFYWHVPNWFMLFSMVFLCGGASIGYLVKRDPKWDDVAHAAGELAVLFGAIGLVTGSIWGKAAWGHWWIWELRLTTSLILWLTMLGYALVRRFAGPGSEPLCAGLAIFGMVNVPLVYFAVKLADKLGQASAHPKAKVVAQLDASMKGTFWLSVLTFAAVCALLFLVRIDAIRDARRLRAVRERGLDAGILEP
ncbi:MAG: cytochrome c biogenesis protein CcsA [Myxococcales bacterium]|nr:cytochrome c biogenesis protein CcsA [Myxococcales bacterium]MBK7196438.1 cytochrome c biogenesis protein CcsA [Myxococcales bacterium]MBP6842639.1 cytochrome c biogenesis protein CcsA [Kofleriaceae bacterium]